MSQELSCSLFCRTDISFSVRRGDILFVRGPSGVGKSLLLRALAYLDPIQV